MTCEHALNFDQWKTFSVKTFSDDYGLFTNLPRIIVVCKFYEFIQAQKRYLSWQNMYPNIKTTCHIKLKFFLWTKLPENLLFAKYLISVAESMIIGCM